MNDSRDTFGQITSKNSVHILEAEEHQSLRPYQDTDYFKKRFLERNRPLRRNPELSEIIGNTLLADDDQSIIDTVELIDLARQLETSPDQPPITLLLAQMSLDREINDIKVSLVGTETPADRVNAITSLTQNILIDQVDDEAIPAYQAAAALIRKQFEMPAFQHATDIDTAWYITKLRFMEAGLTNKQIAVNHIKMLPGEAEETSQIDALHDSQDIADLFEIHRRKQRYGVKMGYKKQDFQEGSLVYAPNIAHEVYAADLHSANYHPITTAREYESLCHVIDSPVSSFKKKIAYKDTTEGGARSHKINIAARGAFDILPNGELRANGSNLLLRDIAVKYGKYSAYRQLQAEVLADYLDLTNPADAPLKESQPSETAIETERGTRTPSDVVRDILLARLPNRRTGEQTDKDTPQSTREVRLHGVVWHIRQLPSGWRASPNAEELAQQAGITLKDGETFVRPHKRGSKALGEVVTHHLVKRSN